MAKGVGQILRQARKRREIDLVTVETATRIRGRFLRAIESEEWDALPGGVYTRGFIRTYAAYLGLDGDRLAEDYRRDVEGSDVAGGPRAEPASAARDLSAGRRSIPYAGALVAAAVVLVGALAIVALPSGGGGGGATRREPQRLGSAPAAPGKAEERPARSPSRGVSVRLAAKAEVWACLLDARGRHLVDGQILEAGAQEGPFHSGSFTVSFGNGEVSMLIDGKEAEIPATASPIGYSIDPSGTLTELSEAKRPTCL